MEQNINLYDSVYHDIVTEIYIGNLKYGDELPSLLHLCDQYSVGRNTARAAVQLLIDNGYVQAVSGKKARVIFDFNNPNNRAFYIAELAQRADAVDDIFNILALIIPDLSIFCIDICTDAQREEIEQALRKASYDMKSPHSFFSALNEVYKFIFLLSENSLLVSLYESLFRFIQIPLSLTEQKNKPVQFVIPIIQEMLRNFEKCIHKKDYNTLKKQLVVFIYTAQKLCISYLERICYGISRKPEIRFNWLVKKRKELLYTSVVYNILKEINRGTYLSGDSIPSYAELAKQNQVSEKTSRKAVSILNRLQVVQTSNGKRAKVVQNNIFHPKNIENFLSDPFISKNLQMCMEANQIMAIISRPVLKKAMKYVNREKINQFLKELEAQSPLNMESLMDFFFLLLPSPAMQHIYYNLKKSMAWGAFLELFNKETAEILLKKAKETAETLKSYNTQKIMDSFYEFYFYIFQEIKDYIEKFGLEVKLKL